MNHHFIHLRLKAVFIILVNQQLNFCYFWTDRRQNCFDHLSVLGLLFFVSYSDLILLGCYSSIWNLFCL